jgi:nucleoside-diphosphate-sugar epimerase
MTATPKESASDREILLVGPYGVLGMSRELGLPLRFPGRREAWNTLQETTDAELFGRATLWALGENKARNEIFNVSNGDVYRWRQLWNELAAFYDLGIDDIPRSAKSDCTDAHQIGVW